MPFYYFIYDKIIFPILYLLFRIASLFNKKVSLGIRGRKNLGKDVFLLKQEIDSKYKEGKLILFHAVSMGEYEQARPLVKKIKENYPDYAFGITFFSPTGIQFYKSMAGIDFVCYSPADKYKECVRFFNTLKPDIFIVVKHDIWPNMIKAAKSMRIKLVLIDATLPPHSKRLSFFAGKFFGYIFSLFDYIFPISAEDENRIKSICSNVQSSLIAGDTRFDQVVARGLKARENKGKKIFNEKYKKVIILGSVWKSDTDNIFEGFIKILKNNPEISGIVVPHEPEEDYVHEIGIELNKNNMDYDRYSGLSKGEISHKRIIIVDTVGVLAELYAYADIAFVGGSFIPGVHNVMEPAIMGIPVLFGPKHENSFEALQLVKKGGAFKVENDDAFYKTIDMLINDTKFYDNAGIIAINYVNENIGATEIIYKQIKEIL